MAAAAQGLGRSTARIWLRTREAALCLTALRLVLAAAFRVLVRILLVAGVHASALIAVQADDVDVQDDATEQTDPPSCRRKRRGGVPLACGGGGAGWAADSAYYEACTPSAPMTLIALVSG